ncbi:TAXI family TRAP transporter solute-binding subunit [Arenibaculum sp.]|uniref:TAXI family TRAP transporter solute-binding subunit n=1 Tax=Arenibaculum sp. TaxID=2865862 RepID=UPI002E0DC36D|nr:TAXI family TRAP transporter solute-binding subunit [Arenibaculum sp.]
MMKSNRSRTHGPSGPLAAVLLLLAALLVAPGAAAETRVLRVGTGGVGGAYYPIGTLIAAGLSDEAAPDLLAVAQTSNGSVANVEALNGGFIELALAQANIVDLAHRGMLPDRPAMTGLRTIANVYVEEMHLVAARDAPIRSPADLRGQRVSLDEPGSGSLGDARAVLWAYGLDEASIRPEYVKPDLAVLRLLEGRLDAFFVMVGTPAPAVAQAGPAVRLIPIDGPPVQRLLERYPTYQRTVIGAETYPGQPMIPTIGVGAQLVTRADLDEETVYEVTRIFWSDRTRRLLDAGHPKGREIRLDRALVGLTIPLHPGAERFYREAGMLN